MFNQRWRCFILKYILKRFRLVDPICWLQLFIVYNGDGYFEEL